MKIPIELTAASRDLLARHFKKGADLHQNLEHAARKDLAGIEIYSFGVGGNPSADGARPISLAVRYIEHAIFATTAG